MSRYSDFEEDDPQEESVLNEEEMQDLVCVKNMLPTPNPLMNKIEYVPYEPKNHYPVLQTKLPLGLAHHEYHIDRNNMALIDESLFSHQRLKQSVAKCIQKGKKDQLYQKQLLTLKEYYCNKASIYEKISNNKQTNNSYFATFTLNLGSILKDSVQKLGKSGFIIRSTKTPLMTERAKTQRSSVFWKPTIDFNSNFECGNLFKVYQKELNEYDLILQNDINTKGNNQWFFFSVRNVPKNTTIKFNIVNMSKKFSLFDYGMKPAVFSLMKYQKRHIGWVRDGNKLSYQQNSQIRKQSSNECYYTLSFQYKFLYEGDIVYFSYTIPYTFTHLTNYLTSTLANRTYHRLVKIKNIGFTLGGNEMSLFQITNSESYHCKKIIWLLARQHSGQVTASFMVEGIVNFLLSGSQQAKYLLDKFIFKLVPMINIDGVVHGNTRAQIVGCDSNRKWDDPHKTYNPIIYSLKKMIQREKKHIEMILDLHSHSRKLGTFFYGNSSHHLSNLIKVFPMMVCKNDHRFDYRSNRFKGGSNQTARKVLFDHLQIPFVYTVQSSFYGYQKQGDFKIIPYQPQDYRQMGASILCTFAELTKKQNNSKNRDQRLFLCNQQELNYQDNLWSRMNQADDVQSIGSDEDPAEDQFNKKQLMAILPKTQKKKTKKNKKKTELKLKQQKIIKQNKIEELIQSKAKAIDKDSYYKKYFSGRCSMNVKKSEIEATETIKNNKQTKNFSVQIDLIQKNVLHRTSMNSMHNQKQILKDNLFQKRSLCVIGQKVEQELTINELNVGIQVQMTKTFLINRNQMQMPVQGATKRIFRSNQKINALMFHNQNNFLNRGDLLHSILRIPSKK